MKKAIALATLISASVFAAGASAQTYGAAAPVVSAEEVTVVNVTNDPSTGNGSRLPMNLTNPGPELIQDAQAQLQSDPALVDALAMKNVQLSNVVHIQTAANGGKVVYVR
ncbi:hypothetical protein ACQKKX_04095 [Neorhizobium sp. NPDC001467]|uniref:hypothetical protein n=1 Tax=Neorhizobium sp. NPDC001467 TaxID=3390595 RepID=UPI003CFDE18C